MSGFTGSDKEKTGSVSVEDLAKEDESHLHGFSPSMLATYNRTLELVLIAPWEGICQHRTCKCDPPLPIKLTTCWDYWNRGRRVLKCANPDGNGCGYKCFVCRGMTGPDPNSMDFLYDRVKRIVAANVVLRSKLAALENAANSLWIREESPLPDPGQGPIDDKVIFTDDDVLSMLNG